MAVSAALRVHVTARARGCCEYCRSQARFALESLSVEHIVPRSRGGETIPENLALSCQGCNNHKYNRLEYPDPLTAIVTVLFHPRRHRWADHFTWNDGFTEIIGLTPTGRATVEALQLNRTPIINLRRVLYSMGEHPPLDSVVDDLR